MLVRRGVSERLDRASQLIGFICTAHKAGKSDETKPKRAKDKLSYNKRGREDFKEAALKSESWKGKQAVKRMQQSQGGQGGSGQLVGSLARIAE